MATLPLMLFALLVQFLLPLTADVVDTRFLAIGGYDTCWRTKPREMKPRKSCKIKGNFFRYPVKLQHPKETYATKNFHGRNSGLYSYLNAMYTKQTCG